MLQNLEITNFRIIKQAELAPSDGLTLIVGGNASGKTSLLEAVNLIFTGRSFRTHKLDQIINTQKSSFQLLAHFNDKNNHKHVLGCERTSKKLRIRYNNDNLSNLSQLATQVPVHLIQPETHQLLENGPKFRRQFIDWGVFHVEPSYLVLWKAFHRTLRQRNALLRRGAAVQLIKAWNTPMAEQAYALHALRTKYLTLLTKYFDEVSTEIMDEKPSINYYCGWDETISYGEILEKSIKVDQELGYTKYGCHKADLILRVAGKTPQLYYSRGQQKLLVSALRIAHYLVLNSLTKPRGILLVDDLPAELDKTRRQQFLTTVSKTKIQTIITATEPELLQLDMWSSQKVFHVEHGNFREVI